MSKHLLWEIGTEELPARFIKPALKSLKELTEKKLKELFLSYEEIKVAGTFRRITLFVKNLAEKQEDREEEILGPPTKIGLDEKGNFTKAAIGFAKKYGVSPEELTIKQTPKGEYFALKRKIYGKKTEELLPSLLLSILKNIYFPKTMRWGSYDFRFARPIRWMLCLYGETIIPLEVAGIRSSNKIKGHRFLSEEDFLIEKADWELYENLLEKNYVIVDPEKRYQKTKEEILKVGEKVGIPEIDEELLLENANLVEYPFPVVGHFSEEFLNLPEPLIITTLKEHQRYFCLRDEKGKLLNYFIAVNNNLAKNPEVVKKGHERVTKARLEDAKFYFEKDLQEPLENKVEKLKGIVYHIKCGTLWDKTQRLIELGKYLAKELNIVFDVKRIEEACFYSKADLASEVVKEFTSLQGVMGSIYAEYFGKKEIAPAIYEQYLPSPESEKLPETPEGIVLSLADKIDHLCALFGSGEKPTGEADPYALRRAAYGIVKILIGKEIFLKLEKVLDFALDLLIKQGFLKKKEVLPEVTSFIKKRMEGEFLSFGFEKNLIATIINLPLDPFDSYLRLKALKDFQKSQDFIDLITGFKRVAQILKNINLEELPEVNLSLFKEEEEKELYNRVLSLQPILKELLKEKKYTSYLENLLSLKESIDRFFDKVFVMVEDEKLRANRLKILSQTAELFNNFGDFTVLI